MRYFVFDDFSFGALLSGALYLLLALALLFVGKKLFDLASSYSLDEEVTEKDNKAVTISFAGFLFGLGLVLQGVVAGDASGTLAGDLVWTAVWCLIGSGLLIAAQRINDRLIFGDFSNEKELVNDKNVGLGAAEAGSYIGAALILRGCLFGEGESFGLDLFSTLLFFVFGQIAFVAFAVYYQRLTSFDFKKAIENDNPAAGLSFGLILIAFGNMLSGPLYFSDSLGTFILWGFLGALLLGVARWIADRLILPGARLDEEIDRDANWGASLLVGGLFIIVSALVNSAVL